MKKEIIFLLMLLAIGSTWLLSCTKDPPPNTNPPPIDYTVLPPITQTGANTFGCLVDGEVWVPRVPLLALTYRDKEATVWEKDNSGTGLVQTNLVDVEKGIDNWYVFTFGKTEFMAKTLCGSEIFANFRTQGGKYYRSDLIKVQTNCVIINKIDSIRNIISGTFNFTLYRDSTNLNDKIEITEGRFDLLYYPQ
jgi:hypothetical protein